MPPHAVDNVNQATGASPADVAESIHRVMHQLRSQQFRAFRGEHGDITPMDGRVLGFFDKNPGATQTDLVEHSGRDKAQLARLIKGLKDRGLLAVEVDPNDRRQLRLRFTDAGYSLRQSLKDQTERLAERAALGLSEAERAQLVGLLERVSLNLGEDDSRRLRAAESC